MTRGNEMLSVREFLNINKHLCEKNHECIKCSLYGDDVCCIFRAKNTDDVPKVVNAIRIAERQVIQEKIEKEPPLIMPMKPYPEEAIAKALKEIKSELHNMKRIMEKRRS